MPLSDADLIRQMRQGRPSDAELIRQMREPTSAGEDLQRMGKTAVKTAGDFLSGANKFIADAIGAPVDLVDEGLRLVGGRLLEEPGNARKAVQEFFAKIGFTNPDANPLVERLGYEGATGLIFAAAAPFGAAVKGAGPISTAVREMGQFARARPVANVGLNVSSAVGAGAGHEIAGPVSEIDLSGGKFSDITQIATKVGAPFVGAALGTGVGAGVGAIVKGTGKVLAAPLEAGARRLGIGARPAEEPFTALPSKDFAVSPDQRTSPEFAKLAAERTFQADLNRLDEAHRRIVEGIGGAADERLGSEAVHRAVGRATEIARAEETRYWNRVPGRTPTRGESTLEYIETVIPRLLEDNPSSVPQDLIHDVLNRATQTDADGAIRAIRVPFERLQNLRSDIVMRRRALETTMTGRRPADETTIQILRELEERLMADQRAALNPRQIRVFEDARNFTDEVDRIFRTGPVGQILEGVGGRGQRLVHPEEAFSLAAKEPGGLAQVLETGRAPNLLQAGRAGGEPTEVQRAAEDTVRAIVREQFGARPQDAQKWLASPRAQAIIRPMGELHVELETAAAALAENHAARAALNRSALARFVDPRRSPEVTVRELFTSGTAAQAAANARELVVATRNTPEALEGLQGAATDAMLALSDLSGRKMIKLLEDPRVKEVFETILSPAQQSAYKQIAGVAADIEQGNQRVLRRRLMPLGNILVRVLGAGFGTDVASLLGKRHNIQIPGLFSRLFADAYNRALRQVPVKDLVRIAITDPNGRALLMQRGPDTISDVKVYNKNIRRLIGRMQGAARLPQGDVDNAGQE